MKDKKREVEEERDGDVGGRRPFMFRRRARRRRGLDKQVAGRGEGYKWECGGKKKKESSHTLCHFYSPSLFSVLQYCTVYTLDCPSVQSISNV